MNAAAGIRATTGRLVGHLRWLARPSYSDFLPQGRAVAENEAAPLARVLVLVIALLFGALLLWAALAQVDQVAMAPGVVRPAGKVKIINHPDGGRVAAVLVSEGQKVVPGQALIKLDPEFSREEIAKLNGEWISQSVRIARLEAEANDTVPEFDAALEAGRTDLVAAQRQLFDARRQSLHARRATSNSVMEQRARDADAAAARAKQLGRSLGILKQQEAAVSDLADKGYFPKLRYLSIQRQIIDLEGQIAETHEALRSAQSALAEAGNRRDSIDKEWRSEALGELATARREIAKIKSTLHQEQTRLRNLAVRAPIAGIVQNITITASGQAIRGNEPLMDVVPTSAHLLVEARVSNDDIGHIRQGQKATVKIRTYDFVRFGSLKGVVDRIAADAVADPETGQMTFNVTIRTDRSHLGRTPRDQPVNPGMQAMVDLHIGKRSILSYLTDRLDRTTQTAFRER